MNLNGIHHITAVSANIVGNIDFYTRILGLRLVKRSVNQDDVSAYHLFYADKLGTPGTDITFFDWPHIRPHLQGMDSITGSAFRVSSTAALDFWQKRLLDHGIHIHGRFTFSGRSLLAFNDPEGLPLYLVDDGGATFEGEPWQRPDIPDVFTLRGFYSAILSTSSPDVLFPIFNMALNFQQLERANWIDGKTEAVIFTTQPDNQPGSELWLLQQPEMPSARLGAGGIHHVAFRVADENAQHAWRSHLIESGIHTTNVIDRYWFRSIYFRVCDGMLFEIATDGPGFAIDEELEVLGEKLVLPPFLEPRRHEIETGLIPINR